MHFELSHLSSLFNIAKLPPYAIVTWFASFLQLQSLNRIVILPETQWSKNCLWLVFIIHEPTSICAHSTPQPTQFVAT
jgi:hypothetical protein